MVGPSVVLAELSGKSQVTEFGSRLTYTGELERTCALLGLGRHRDGAGDSGRSHEQIGEPHDV